MVEKFRFPDVGEGIREGKLVEWKVSEGEPIEEDQTLAEVETDKAVVDVPSKSSGKIESLKAEAGDLIEVGEVILTYSETDQEEGIVEETESKEEKIEKDEPVAKKVSDTEKSVSPGTKVKAMPRARKFAEEKGVSLNSVQKTFSLDKVTKEDIEKYLDGRKKEKPKENASGKTAESETFENVVASPSTKKYALNKGVNIQEVEGTGPGGRIEKDDIDKFLKNSSEEDGEVVREKESKAPVGRVDFRKPDLSDYDFKKYGKVEKESVSSIRRAITKNMVESKYTAPHVTVTREVQVSELWDIKNRKKKHAEEKNVKLTLTPFIAKAVLGALMKYPYMNSSYDEEKGEIIKKKFYNLGIAVATKEGLKVPVIKEADNKTILELGKEINSLAEKAREGGLKLDEIRGSTFSITNWGSIGGEYGTPVINFPDVGILGIGRVKEKPVAKNGEVSIEKVLPLSLTFDHRIIDGAYAARFIESISKHLEDSELLLIED